MAIQWHRWYKLLLFSLIYLGGMLFLSLSLTMIIGTGYLGYSEETDDLVCYANSTSNIPMPLNSTSSQLSQYNAHNVSQQFRYLLRGGWYIYSIQIVIWIIYYTGCVQDHKTVKKVMRYIIAAISLVYLAYFITSNVIRFQHTGRVCAGDFGNPFPPMTPLLNHTRDINERTIEVDDSHRLLEVVVPPKE